MRFPATFFDEPERQWWEWEREITCRCLEMQSLNKIRIKIRMFTTLSGALSDRPGVANLLATCPSRWYSLSLSQWKVSAKHGRFLTDWSCSIHRMIIGWCWIHWMIRNLTVPLCKFVRDPRLALLAICCQTPLTKFTKTNCLPKCELRFREHSWHSILGQSNQDFGQTKQTVLEEQRTAESQKAFERRWVRRN